VGFLDRSVPSGTHVCAFVSGPEQRDEVVLPFLADGIRAGQKCICILESLDPPDVRARLGRQVDVAEPVQTGQVQLGTPADAYLASGRFDTEDMLSYWEQAATQNSGTYGLTRGAGEMPSVLDNPTAGPSSSGTRPGSPAWSPGFRRSSCAFTTCGGSGRRR
jgi:hypothetical protein